MQRVRGVVKHYAWGDQTFIPGLLGVEADGRPWAELWLGTHPNGPAHLADDGAPLSDLTGELPYLLKVLAAARPLSLQTHPDAARAARGHAAGYYPDPNPKPELLCALTPFEALCGIRPTEATAGLLEEIGAIDMARVLETDGPEGVLHALYRGELDTVPVITACRGSGRAEATWVVRLADDFPGQPSVVATLLLNHVRLEPGEALRLGAGNLHAYLAGNGVELMGASDNVVRGGLTDKPVDVDELLQVVDPTPLAAPVLALADRYPLEGVGVALVRLEPGATHRAVGFELTVDLGGVTLVLEPGDELRPDVTTFVVSSDDAPAPA